MTDDGRVEEIRDFQRWMRGLHWGEYPDEVQNAAKRIDEELTELGMEIVEYEENGEDND